MNRTSLLTLATVALLASLPAAAQEATSDAWQRVQGTQTRVEVQRQAQVARAKGDLDVARSYDLVDRNYRPMLSRAEVLADTQIWRESGLAALDRGEASYHVFSPNYELARARYMAMRSSPSFAVLVQTIAVERGERQLAVRQSAAGENLIK